MSWVSNMMLSVSIEDCDAFDQIVSWLETAAPMRAQSSPDGRRGAVGSLRDTTGPGSLWGGSLKAPECQVWAGALNHADLDAVVARVAAADWRVPAAVQLFLMDQEQIYFRVWMVRDGRMQQYAPPPPDDGTAW